MSVALYQRPECQICLTDPFERNPELRTTSWNGHYIITNAGISSETRIIHGICQQCLPSVPITQLRTCFTCRQPFPNNRRTTVIITKEGNLVREKLESATVDPAQLSQIFRLFYLSITLMMLSIVALSIKNPEQKALMPASLLVLSVSTGTTFASAYLIRTAPTRIHPRVPLDEFNEIDGNLQV